MSEMSVGTPGEEARVIKTATTTARRAGKARGRGGKKKAAEQGPRRPQLRKNARVVVERRHINLQVPPGQPGRDVLDQNPRADFNFYGVYVSAAQHGVFNIKLDLFPSNAPPVPVARSQIKRVLRPDEEEPSHDREEEEVIDELDPDAEGAKKKKPNYAQQSVDDFLKEDDETRRRARSFKYKYGPGTNDFVAWQILTEEEQIVSCPMEEGVNARVAHNQEMESALQEEGRDAATTGNTTETIEGIAGEVGPNNIPKMPAMKGMTFALGGVNTVDNPQSLGWDPINNDDIPWDPDPSKVDYNGIFFKHFFPSVEGKAAGRKSGRCRWS